MNPFTPKSDQCQISPAASPEILHHTVRRTWLFHTLLRWKTIILPILATSLIHFIFKRLGRECLLFELRSEKVKPELSLQVCSSTWDGFSTRTAALRCLQLNEDPGSLSFRPIQFGLEVQNKTLANPGFRIRLRTIPPRRIMGIPSVSISSEQITKAWHSECELLLFFWPLVSLGNFYLTQQSFSHPDDDSLTGKWSQKHNLHFAFLEERDFCLPNPCKNEGTCYETASGYKCLCRSGFTGTECEGDWIRFCLFVCLFVFSVTKA